MKFDLSTIVTIITGVINLTLLGFLINFFKTFREISQEREQLIKEQKNLSESKTQVVEKELAYTDRQNKQLLQEKEQLQKQLSEALKSEGIDINFLLNNSSLKELTAGFTDKVEHLTRKLEDVQEHIQNNKQHDIIDGEYHLSLGNGFVVNSNWAKATYHLDLAAISYPEDWNLHFTRGVSYANMRGGTNTNIKGIEAYTQAIIHIPGYENEFKSKIHIYRGALFKRINKLDEAELDVEFGLANTQDRYFIADAKYNLACIYAMQNKREKLFSVLRELKNSNTFKPGLRFHLNDYFLNFKTDKEFLELIT
jgi:tetratricopeptide (TPR) repeat protein